MINATTESALEMFHNCYVEGNTLESIRFIGTQIGFYKKSPVMQTPTQYTKYDVILKTMRHKLGDIMMCADEDTLRNFHTFKELLLKCVRTMHHDIRNVEDPSDLEVAVATMLENAAMA